MIKAIIFDMDGVIFDSEELWKEALSTLRAKYHLDTLTEAVRQKSCGMDEHQQQRYFKPYMPEGLKVEDFSNEWKDLVSKKLLATDLDITKSGFEEILEYLKSKKYKIGLNSGSPRELIRKLFSRTEFDERKIFDSIVSGDDLSLGKPDPEGYIKSCQNLNLKPEECLVLEDSTNGLISAMKAGCPVINVLDNIIPPKHIQKKCVFVAKSLNETLEFLKKNNI